MFPQAGERSELLVMRGKDPFSMQLDKLASELRRSLQEALDRLGPSFFPLRDLDVDLVAGLDLLSTPEEPGGRLFALLPGLGSLPGPAASLYRLQARLSSIPGVPVSEPLFRVVPALGQVRGKTIIEDRQIPIPGLHVALFRGGKRDDILKTREDIFKGEGEGRFPNVLTDKQGTFHFSRVPAGPWVVVARDRSDVSWSKQEEKVIFASQVEDEKTLEVKFSLFRP